MLKDMTTLLVFAKAKTNSDLEAPLWGFFCALSLRVGARRFSAVLSDFLLSGGISVPLGAVMLLDGL